MTEDLKKSRQRLNANRPTTYEIGYAKPPVAARFQKGKSGNPRGRPKNAKSKFPRLNEERLKTIILTEAYRTIKVREGEKNVTLSMAEAVFRSVSVNAVKGNLRAQRLFTQLLEGTERANKKLADEWLETAIEYKVSWEKEFARRKHLGLPIPEPIPHPDHIEIDMRTGEVIVKGPFTPEDKARWDKLRKRKHDCLEEIKELQKLAKRSRKPEYRKLLEDEIEYERRIYERISTVIKD